MQRNRYKNTGRKKNRPGYGTGVQISQRIRWTTSRKNIRKANARAGPVTRLTGSASNFKPPAARTEIRRNSFAVRTISKWNELPEEVKNSNNATGFKLKTHRENGGMAQQLQ
jgi:hypothetical protein